MIRFKLNVEQNLEYQALALSKLGLPYFRTELPLGPGHQLLYIFYLWITIFIQQAKASQTKLNIFLPLNSGVPGPACYTKLNSQVNVGLESGPNYRF